MPNARATALCGSTGSASRVLSLGIGALQMMLDRGQDQDWFAAQEIIIEAVLAGLGIYLFLVHMSAAKTAVSGPALFRDRNFSAGLAMMFAVGTLLVSSLALMAPWLQNLGDYPVETAGLVMAPRGFGKMVHDDDRRAAVLAHRPAADGRHRAAVAAGRSGIMTGWTPDVSERELILAIIVQGAGLGLVFIPLQVLAFATLRAGAAHRWRLAVQPVPQYRRGDRRFGGIIDAGAQHAGVHERSAPSVNPFNRALGGAGRACLDPATRAWRGDAGPAGQPAGADHRLYR